MILTLKTDTSDAHISLIKNDDIQAQETWASGRELAKHLLSHIDQLLKNQNASWQDIDGAIVFKGPGSFTGLRIGITVANTLAYSNDIPVVGTSGDDWLGIGLSRLKKGENDRIVMPEYGAEAHITKPKK